MSGGSFSLQELVNDQDHFLSALIETRTSISKAIEQMVNHKQKLLAIVDSLEKKTLLGVLSERDILKSFLSDNHTQELIVDDLMTKTIQKCTLEDSLLKALNILRDFNCRHVPLVDPDNHILGIVTEHAIAKALMTKLS